MAFNNAPLDVHELTDLAAKYEYNPYIPLKNWLRTANSMKKEAQVYAAEGNDQQTYLLLYRHAHLLLDHLQKHPQRNDPENRRALSKATGDAREDIQKMEEIRPRIKKRYEDYQARRKAQQKTLQSIEEKSVRLVPQEWDGPSGQAPRRSYEKQSLDAVGNQSLAAKLAQREVKRRDAARRNVRQAGVSEEEESDRRTGGVWGDWEKELGHHSVEADGDLSAQLQEIARMQQNGHRASDFSRPQSQTTSSYHYPSVPHHGQQQRWTDTHSSQPVPARPPKEHLPPSYDSSVFPPALPPKPPRDLTPRLLSEQQPQPPPVPGKYTEAPPSVPPIPSKVRPTARASTPTTDLDEFTFKPSAYLENGTPLRTIFLPTPLRKHFLAAAERNTRMNLETCGMLCGILKNNALFITRLVIPAQTSTSDTCEMTNESDLFDYCDKEELMVLGWIHTHPSQTCFMSSRDLHTHVGYQVMMPESIAIVCAPSKSPSWGCFRLTDPPGKQAILECTQPGIFHPHHVENIYTEALKPGHVVELDNGPLEVVDMRPKR
ncbi:hypothetical protein BU23DRAFT_551122 [Bimuria novae-zelandiae CBS 107.79]|uniref:MPN domain-containing protein n=1 Tax=Bimuria novae-zelandiae CBS 107.79 TaxID=1447943 RepID=A0A6A5VJM4_9PLEO|nr:hypothetical protein BU23DRAFT_551122 [Bimuria novae-zelandiae CBS 107.79]